MKTSPTPRAIRRSSFEPTSAYPTSFLGASQANHSVTSNVSRNNTRTTTVYSTRQTIARVAIDNPVGNRTDRKPAISNHVSDCIRIGRTAVPFWGLSSGPFLCSRICSQLEMVLSAPSHEILPRNCAKLVFLASKWLGFFLGTYLELFPASPDAQFQEITFVRYFFYPSGSTTITIKDRIGKTRKVQAILRRETAGSHIFGAKGRANVPIAPFPTDCKPDCMRSGLKTGLEF